MVCMEEIKLFGSLDRGEMIANWLNNLPRVTGEGCEKWDSNNFFMSSDDEDNEDSMTNPSYSESECSDPSCEVCVYNQTCAENVGNDDVFQAANTINNELNLDVDFRQRLISNVSVRIMGCHVEKVQWDKRDSDLLLKINESLFPVHREVLSSHSQVLQYMVLKNDELILQLHENITHMKTILDYLYGFKLELNDSNVNQILTLSRRFGINAVTEKCKQYSNALKKTDLMKKSPWNKLTALLQIM